MLFCGCWRCCGGSFAEAEDLECECRTRDVVGCFAGIEDVEGGRSSGYLVGGCYSRADGVPVGRDYTGVSGVHCTCLVGGYVVSGRPTGARGGISVKVPIMEDISR